MYHDLKNKVAIVTGAAGILGGRFCHALLKAGVNLVMVDKSEKGIVETTETLKKQHANAKILPLVCDITDKNAVQNMVDQVVKAWGEINILHNNAATKGNDLSAFFTSFEEYSLETWREVMTVNVEAAFVVAQTVGKQMILQGRGGSIIQTASIYGVVAPNPSVYQGSHYLGREINTPAVYSASKAALLGLTRHLASYWAKHNIRVNALTPGGIESGQNEVFQQNYSKQVPLGRMGKADELCGALLFLASDQSSYVTGQNIIIDGGYSCW